MKIQILILFIAVASLKSSACPIGKTGLTEAQLKVNLSFQGKTRSVANTSAIPTLPSSSSSQPWGGANSAIWKPEAIFANAISKELNEGWKKSGAEEVLVSVPVKMEFTNRRVYGDGQTNASLGFGPNWNEREPQMVATLIKLKTEQRTLQIVFSKKITFTQPTVILTGFYSEAGNLKQKDTALSFQINQQNKTVTWNVPSNLQFGGLNSSRLIWIRPSGWDSIFPIDFRMPIHSNTTLLKAAF